VTDLTLAFIALQAVLFAIALAVAISRGRTIEELREATGAKPGVDLESSVRSLIDRTGAAEWQAVQAARDTALLADLIGVGIVRLDDDLVVDFANATVHIFVGRQPGSMVGLSGIEAFVDHRIEEIVERARQTGAASGELTIGSASGFTVTVRARRSPVRGVWVVLEDVSELRRLQRIRAEFIDNLSHELRTPLTTVSLLAETLVREADHAGDAIPPRVRDRMAKIEVETGHLVQMVSELLDLSRIESGGPLVLLDAVDLAKVAAASTDRLTLFAERQGVRLATELPAVVATVRGDEARLGQVLVNLLHNAIKFSPNGGDVTVRVERAGDEVVLSVEDHGIGIPAADLPRIFERFYKVDRARVRGGGTGLGLAITRHVIESHGGRVWVRSEEGVGSTFSFALPIAEVAGD
jgi:two-component system phosphate regulon sensor histidine kinase PhoR